MRCLPLIVSAAVLLLAACTTDTSTTGPDVEGLATEAYLYGYAPVAMARTRGVHVCALGTNRLYNQPATATPESRTVVAPNVDTLYSVAWLDLRTGPVVLTVGATGGRYYDFQLLDLYSNTFENLGVRTHGAGPGSYTIVPPGWEGTVAGTVVEAPTWDVWLLGRTVVDPADLDAAHAVQAGYSIRVITSLMNDAPPPLPPTDCANPPKPQDLANAGAAFYDELSAVLTATPPPERDAALLKRLAGIGVGPGMIPTRDHSADALEAGVRAGERRITTPEAKERDGWRVSLDIGEYGTDYLLRAQTAKYGLAANVAGESLYYFAQGTGDGELRFTDLPPIGPGGFWSITVYDEDSFLVPNASRRYAISDRTHGVVTGADGSLVVRLSATPGGNWLPVPRGPYRLILRVYLPGRAAASGDWMPPPIIPAR